MSLDPDVRIASRRVRLSAVREAPASYSRDFEQARVEPGHAWCLCNSSTPQRLVIRRKSHAGTAAAFFLAGWPEGGEAHDIHCPFYKEPEDESGKSSESKSCFEEGADGTFRITPQFSVSLKVDTVVRKKDAIEASPRPSESTRGATLLAMLQYLWSETGLHRWRAGWYRDWGRVRYELMGKVEDGQIGKRPLADVLYIPPRYTPAAAERNKAEFTARQEPLFTSARQFIDAQNRIAAGKAASAVRETLFIIAPLRGVKESQFDSYQIQLGHIAQPVYCKAPLMQRLQRRFGRVLNTLNAEHGHVIGIFHVEGTPRGHLQLLDAGLMRVSSRFIPVDSSYEEVVADALVMANRDFSKPVKIETGTDSLDGKVLADFILYDTASRRCYMEVYGVEGRAEYDVRKREKQHIYRQNGVEIWEWDLTRTREMPALPPRIERTAA